MAGGGNLTIGPVNVRIEDPADDPIGGEDVPDVRMESLRYTDHEHGFALQLPEEWAGLSEIENASGDGSVLTLYHIASRREDDPTAGVPTAAPDFLTVHQQYLFREARALYQTTRRDRTPIPMKAWNGTAIPMCSPRGYTAGGRILTPQRAAQSSPNSF